MTTVHNSTAAGCQKNKLILEQIHSYKYVYSNLKSVCLCVEVMFSELYEVDVLHTHTMKNTPEPTSRPGHEHTGADVFDRSWVHGKVYEWTRTQRWQRDVGMYKEDDDGCLKWKVDLNTGDLWMQAV